MVATPTSYRALLTLFLAATVSASEPAWETIPQVRAAPDDSPYADLVAHFPNDHQVRWKEFPSLPTTVHENNHFLNAVYSNRVTLFHRARVKQHVFYIGRGRCFVLGNPRTRRSQAAALTPRIAAFAKRDQTYVRPGPTSPPDDRPLYLLDEWLAYMQDARQSIYMASNPDKFKDHPLEDEIGALAEMAFFCTCLAQTIERTDPEYADGRFHSFFRWCHEESGCLYQAALRQPRLRRHDAVRQALCFDPQAESMRAWVKGRYDLDVKELYPAAPEVKETTHAPMPAASALRRSR